LKRGADRISFLLSMRSLGTHVVAHEEYDVMIAPARLEDGIELERY
jgi:hypothetical protein